LKLQLSKKKDELYEALDSLTYIIAKRGDEIEVTILDELDKDKKEKLKNKIKTKLPKWRLEEEDDKETPITLTKKYTVKEEYYTWDDDTGEVVKRLRNKKVKKIIKKLRIKENYILDESGDFYRMDKKLRPGFIKKGNIYLTEDRMEVTEQEATEWVRANKSSKGWATEEVDVEVEENVYEER